MTIATVIDLGLGPLGTAPVMASIVNYFATFGLDIGTQVVVPSIWTPVSAASGSWSATASASGIWTPTTPAGGTWS